MYKFERNRSSQCIMVNLAELIPFFYIYYKTYVGYNLNYKIMKLIHPNEASLFDEYVQSQNEECDELENDIIGVTLLLQKIY